VTPCMGADEGIGTLAWRHRTDKFTGDLFLSQWENEAEVLVHELAHAISLGVPLLQPDLTHANLPIAVGVAASHLPEHVMRRNEALTLASEAYALRALGIECDRATLAHAARMQGVHRDVFAVVWDSREAQDLGRRVMRYIGRHLKRRDCRV
jgi:hypothetical protein